jgi:hypothetical protein
MRQLKGGMTTLQMVPLFNGDVVELTSHDERTKYPDTPQSITINIFPYPKPAYWPCVVLIMLPILANLAQRFILTFNQFLIQAADFPGGGNQV